ncbi:MAG: putative sugar nucleotidyl transferase [Pirellulales bacterium]
MHVLFFEDGLVDRLAPITLGRPAYAITCGAARLIDVCRLESAASVRSAVVRPHLFDLQRAEFPELRSWGELSSGGVSGQVLLVNSRLVPDVRVVAELQRLAGDSVAGVIRCGDSIVAAVVPGDWLPSTEGQLEFLEALSRLVERLPLLSIDGVELLEYPHDVVRWHTEILLDGLSWRLSQAEYREVRPGVFVGEGVTLPDSFATDTSAGPIVLDKSVMVSPFAILHGPLWVGARARIMEHAIIKGGVSLGPTTKVGGEVLSSVIEAYSNKQHYGFLGHSYVGSWVNLGAGTSNSDLKNTYGMVNMEYGDRKVATGLQFMGCIVGDYTKTAVNTSIFTGKVLGVGSMVYGYVTSNVPSFTNYARGFGQVTELTPDILAETQRRTFLRRQVEQRPYHVELLRAMHELTRSERIGLEVRPLAF